MGTTDIGQKFPGSPLSPPLWIGETLEYFHVDGSKPVSRDLLKITVSGSAISQTAALKMKAETPTGPVAFPTSRCRS